MADFGASLIAMFSSAAGAATQAVGSAIAGVGGSGGILGGGSMFANILQGGVGLVGAMSAAREGDAKARALELQVEDAKLDAKQEDINGLLRQDQQKRAMLQRVGEIDTAYAASGVDLSFGTPASARSQSMDDANRALSMDQTTTEMRRSRLMERASNYSAMASEARNAGGVKGAGLILSSLASINRRG